MSSIEWGTPRQKAKFFKYFEEGPLNECWIWAGPVRFIIHGRSYQPHRLVFDHFKGVPPGSYRQKYVALCLRPDCVNPNHRWPLEVGKASRARLREVWPEFTRKFADEQKAKARGGSRPVNGAREWVA
jgi:hypothetical protein